MRHLITLALVILLSACMTLVSPRYGASADNIEALRASLVATGTKVAVGSFATFEPGLSSIKCGGGKISISPPDGLSYERYIEQAIISELKIAGVFAADSPVRLDARLDYIDFSISIGGVGKWQIDATFQGPGVAPFTINTVYSFPIDFFGKHCNQLTNAVPGAVQDLIGKLVAHPSFKQLVARQQ